MDISYFLEERGLIANPYISKKDYNGVVQGIWNYRGSTSDNTDLNSEANSNSNIALMQLLNGLPDSSYKDFGILIPKIKADAPIVLNVDPYDINVYKVALGKGIAHANTSAKPGEIGNIFLFAHSGRNFYDSIGVNVQFYMLDKLESGDLIIINFEKQKFVYQVKEVKIVEQTDSEYMFKNYTYQEDNPKTLVLMSCWPAGMNIKRQVVISEQIFASPQIETSPQITTP
jgi:LPXTG-site transpeptidase (sortase) family protein